MALLIPLCLTHLRGRPAAVVVSGLGPVARGEVADALPRAVRHHRLAAHVDRARDRRRRVRTRDDAEGLEHDGHRPAAGDVDGAVAGRLARCVLRVDGLAWHRHRTNEHTGSAHRRPKAGAQIRLEEEERPTIDEDDVGAGRDRGRVDRAGARGCGPRGRVGSTVVFAAPRPAPGVLPGELVPRRELPVSLGHTNVRCHISNDGISRRHRGEVLR